MGEAKARKRHSWSPLSVRRVTPDVSTDELFASLYGGSGNHLTNLTSRDNADSQTPIKWTNKDQSDRLPPPRSPSVVGSVPTAPTACPSIGKCQND
jgi:hypothetical protein